MGWGFEQNPDIRAVFFLLATDLDLSENIQSITIDLSGNLLEWSSSTQLQLLWQRTI